MTLLITGAAGAIGTRLAADLATHGVPLRLLDRRPSDAGPPPGVEFVQADLRDLDATEKAAAGISAIVHLAGITQEGPFADMVEHNITGTHHAGENTDVDGMLQALLDAGITRVESACVLGAGATAATALAALHTLDCREPTVIARDMVRTRELTGSAERIGTGVRFRPWAEASRYLTASLVVSALPPGAADPLAASWSAAGNTLLDVVYRPWPTPLALAAIRAGSTVIGGLPMLIHQAARQVELQTGHTPAACDA